MEIKRNYTKPAIVQHELEAEGNLLAGSEKTLNMSWKDADHPNGKDADPNSEILSKGNNGGSGLWDDEN